MLNNNLHTSRLMDDSGPASGAWFNDGYGDLINPPDTPFLWTGSSKSVGGHQGQIDGVTGGSTSVSAGGSTSTSPFVINITWDASVSAAPAGFTAGVQAAVQYLESQFVDPVTINIGVGYGEVNGAPLSGGSLGQSYYWLNSLSYSQLTGALTADAKTAADQSAVASLPASSPVNGTFWTTTAQSKALGLTSGSGTAMDGYVGFSSSYALTYNDSNGVAAGTYDFEGVVLHEITEVMGRAMLTGGSVGSMSPSYYAADLFHYSSPGVRDFSASTPGYFSIDGGTTNLGNFNTAGGDPGDWAASVANDSFDAASASGVVNAVSANDLTLMDTIGWDPTGSAPPPPSPPPSSTPTGVVASPVTAAMATAQTASGLAANAVLAKFAQVGGAAGDSYTYSLGGTGASSFALSTAGNVATLAIGGAGAAGAANGALYALAVTATDVTAGTSAPASAVAVIVGSSGNDTINLATLTGALGTATPTFVYGLAGADQVNGSGMTGNLWFVGGAGADTMTGGSGVNDYMYSAVTDSPGSTPDIITDFHAADKIDLTGLGIALNYDGSVPSTVRHGHTVSNLVLPAHSVGWQASGGNTFVYVNTSGSGESLGGSNMKVELLGGMSLTGSNIVHL